MAIVDAVADRGSYVVADRVLGLVRAIFNWAIGKGRLEANPTLGLKKRNTSRPRERVLRLGRFASCGLPLWQLGPLASEICDALKLQLLLGVRIGEALGAAKSEIDLDRRVWTIPALRTKSKREHRLPLPSVAARILRSALNRAGDSRWLFPSPSPRRPDAFTFGDGRDATAKRAPRTDQMHAPTICVVRSRLASVTWVWPRKSSSAYSITRPGPSLGGITITPSIRAHATAHWRHGASV